MNERSVMSAADAERVVSLTNKILSAPLDDDEVIGWGDDCLPIFNFAKLDGPEPEPLQWVLKGYVPEREVTFFTGEGATGKSLSAQQLATSIASSIPFLGLSTSSGDDSAVLYVTAEEGEDELERRQRNINRALGVDRFTFDGHLFLSSLRGKEGNELCTFDADGSIEPTPAYRKLGRTIMNAGADVVILDNVAHLFGGNENDRRQVTAFVNLLYRLVRIYKCSIVLIGHPNKSGDTWSGSTAWPNAVRSQIFLERVKDEHGNVTDPDRRVLINPKANYGPSHQRLYFRWHEGAFWRDEDLPSDYQADMAAAQKASAENEIFLSCLRARMATPGREVGASIGPNYAPARFAEMTEAKGMKKPALARAMERLIYIGAITTKEVKREGKGGYKTILVEVDPNAPELPPEAAQISPEDAELLETRKFGVEEICRLFQVPPPIVQDYSHNTFTNSETAGRWFATFCLAPWARKIEAEFARSLFPTTSSHELELDLSGFLRGDPETRWNAHKIALETGVLDPDEVREVEGWNPRRETPTA